MSETIEKIKELGKRILNMRDEIRKNQLILSKYESEMAMLMKEMKSKSFIDEVNKFRVLIEVHTSSRFDSTQFKKENPEVYESFRTVSKRFNQNKLKKEEPELYKSYITKETSESMTIEKLESEEMFEDLPEL